MKIWTISEVDGTFRTLAGARNAWESEGCKRTPGSSVWATESMVCGGVAETVRTITLLPA